MNLRRAFSRLLSGRPFAGSANYWEERYAAGGSSGVGSYSKFAAYKADVLNRFVAEHAVDSVIEWGCGDGNQAERFEFPFYLGVDVSPTVVARCRERFAGDPTRRFLVTDGYRGESADLALSLDVIYHLVEDQVFDDHMRSLFTSSHRWVIVYSSNDETIENRAVHVRHRRFTDWIETNAPEWQLVEQLLNPYPYDGDVRTGSFADFYVFELRVVPVTRP